LNKIKLLSPQNKLLEIEGLRGIAVLAIIIGHLNDNYLQGGFLGVDVFFVISGFVISKSLDNYSKESLKQYLLEFYKRRLRRVFPALFVCVVLITILSICLIQGIDNGIIRTGGTSLLGLSNLYQIKLGNDYFGLASKLNVFTHTWSLGVEEQFYLVFPILVFALYKYHKNVIIYFSIFTLISFLIFIALFFIDKTTQYYFPLSRFWELFTGVLTFFLVKKSPQAKINNIHKTITHLYLILLLTCFMAPNNFILFVSPIVCILTALIIYRVSYKNYAPLKNICLTYTGKISYSLYLYHLPIIIIVNLDGSYYADLFTLILIYSVSFLSYKYVETPFRDEASISLWMKPLTIYIPTAILVSALIFFYTKINDTHDPFSMTRIDGFESCSIEDISNRITKRCLLNNESGKQMFFLGDSHSTALLPMMKLLHQNHGYQVHSLKSRGLFTRKFSSNKNDNIKLEGETIAKFIFNNINRGDIVILSNRLVSYFSKMIVGDQSNLLFNNKHPNTQEAFSIHLQDLQAMATDLNKHGARFIILAPVPDFEIHPITCYSPIVEYFTKYDFGKSLIKNQLNKCMTTRVSQVKKRGSIVQALNKLANNNENTYIWDLIDLICDEKKCSSYKHGVPIYFDDDHINHNLAPYLSTDFLKLIL
jgi:peptidoglycan/LPS O-acetylase OafA/YrhL